MSQIDENQIHDRLKRLSQIEPAQDAVEHAKQRVRETIGRGRPVCLPRATTWGRPYRPWPVLAKLAAAAVLLLGAGFLAGRLCGPEPIDVESLRQSLLAEMSSRQQSAFEANCARLKDELQQQVRRELMQFAAQTLTASGTQTQQQIKELIQLIEAARVQDRRNVEAALEHMESQFGSGLVALAARTNELQRQ